MLLSPLEYLYLRSKELPMNGLEIAGVCLACLGGIVFASAWLASTASYAGRLFGAEDRPVRQGGIYRFIRHPDYLGYLLAALGLALGFRSVWGGAALLFVLLPAILLCIRMEERLLTVRFGASFREYATKTKRLIPGVW